LKQRTQQNSTNSASNPGSGSSLRREGILNTELDQPSDSRGRAGDRLLVHDATAQGADREAVPPQASSPRSFANALFRHWPAAFAVFIAVVALAGLATMTRPAIYRATAVAAVVPLADQLAGTDMLRSVEALDRRVIVASVAALATTVAPEAEGPRLDVSAAVMPNTSLIRITVEGADPQRAADVANLLPGQLSGQTRSLYRVYDVVLVSPAEPPTESARPRLSRALALGALAGLLLGLLTASLLESRAARA
jgi:hypothetical protein